MWGNSVIGRWNVLWTINEEFEKPDLKQEWQKKAIFEGSTERVIKPAFVEQETESNKEDWTLTAEDL